MFGAEPNRQSIDRIKTKIIEQLRDEDPHEAIVALIMVLAAMVIVTSRSSSSAGRCVDVIYANLKKLVSVIKPPEMRQ